jgi:signal transduction histidine kinase
MTNLAGQINALKQGEHLCSVYDSTSEMMAQAVPYLKHGLLSGEQCIYVADENTNDNVLLNLRDGGIDIDQAMEEKHLFLWNRHDYKPAGPFNREVMFHFVQGSVEKALAQGFSGLRLAIEMTWAANSGVTLPDLIAWESLLNRLSYPGSKASFICMYNRGLLASALIREAVYVHPVVVLGEQVCPNLFYQPPEIALESKTEEEKLQWMLSQITRADLAEKALVQKTKALEASNAELERFAYAASHDLREPLRLVTSYVELLAKRYKGRLDSDADDFINFALMGVHRMNRLIQGTLTYARVGLSAPIFEAVNCEEILTDVLANLDSSIEETSAEIFRQPLPMVSGNRFLLSQVFQNLIHNAIKYHCTVPPVICISSQTRDGECLFMVGDNGVGIDPLYHRKIFEIFQRLDSLDEKSGCGIGLAICKKALERHGGNIWVESQLGKGAAFYFTIPVGPQIELADPTEKASYPKHTPARSSVVN